MVYVHSVFQLFVSLFPREQAGAHDLSSQEVLTLLLGSSVGGKRVKWSRRGSLGLL